MSNLPFLNTPPPFPIPTPVLPDPFFDQPADPALQNLPATWQPTIDNIGSLRSLLPPNWFPEEDPVLDAILATFADSILDVNARNDWVYTQMRLRTATGIWLDMYAEELFGIGGWMYRRRNEGDEPYRKRLLFEVLCQRGTRQAMHDVLKHWLGNEPIIIEPWNPNDTGTWDTQTFFWDQEGYWGSTNDNFTSFVIASRSGRTPIQFYNDETIEQFLVLTPGLIGGTFVESTNKLWGGYDVGSFFWIDDDFNQSQVTDKNVYETINRTKPAGTKVFVHLNDSEQLPNDPDAINFYLLDYNFVLNKSTMDTIQSQISHDGFQAKVGSTFILGKCMLGVTAVLERRNAPYGFVDDYLDLNFILNRSMLAGPFGDEPSGMPILYPHPGMLAGTNGPGRLPFYTDISGTM